MEFSGHLNGHLEIAGWQVVLLYLLCVALPWVVGTYLWLYRRRIFGPTPKPGELWAERKKKAHPWDQPEVRRVRVLDVRDGWVKFEPRAESGWAPWHSKTWAFCDLYRREK